MKWITIFGITFMMQAVRPQGRIDPFSRPERKAVEVVMNKPMIRGIVTTHDRSVALLSLHDTVRVVSSGDVFQGYDVQKIGVDHVVVARDGVLQTLTIE